MTKTLRTILGDNTAIAVPLVMAIAGGAYITGSKMASLRHDTEMHEARLNAQENEIDALKRVTLQLKDNYHELSTLVQLVRQELAAKK